MNNDLEWKLYNTPSSVATEIICDFSNIEFKEINILCFLNGGNNEWGTGLLVLKDEFSQVNTNKRIGQSFHYSNIDYHINCTVCLCTDYKIKITGNLAYGATEDNNIKAKVLYR